jgi:hypothetical protein
LGGQKVRVWHRIWCGVIQVGYVTRISFAFLFGLVKSRVDETSILETRVGVRWKGVLELLGMRNTKVANTSWQKPPHEPSPPRTKLTTH